MPSEHIKITYVSCLDKCISCAACVQIAPDVFCLNPETNMAEVIANHFCGLEAEIILARDTCPVCNISVNVEGGTSEVVFRTALVQSVRRLTKNTIELRLTLPTFSFLPGQYISLKMQDEGGEFFRAYSVVDFENECIRLCIKLGAHGRASSIFSKVKVGDELFASEAKGAFSIPQNGLKPTANVLVGTGTGVAPLLAIAKALSVPTTILLGFRSEEDIIYWEELEELATVRVKVVLSKPSKSWQGLRGRVTDHLESLNLPIDSQVYICGNKTMIQAVETRFDTLGFDRRNIITESYDPDTPVAPKVPLWQVPIPKWTRTN